MATELFHLTTPAAWVTAQADGEVAPPILAAEGFVDATTWHRAPDGAVTLPAGLG